MSKRLQPILLVIETSIPRHELTRLVNWSNLFKVDAFPDQMSNPLLLDAPTLKSVSILSRKNVRALKPRLARASSNESWALVEIGSKWIDNKGVTVTVIQRASGFETTERVVCYRRDGLTPRGGKRPATWSWAKNFHRYFKPVTS